MSTWMLIALLGLIKLPIAALMMWLPFRDDEAMHAASAPSSGEDDGGSRALPAGPLDPHPHRPRPDRPPRRRGPHSADPAPSPLRVRSATARRRRVHLAR